MKSERFWVLVLALTTFCAGIAAGVLIALRHEPRPDRAYADYEADMIEAFDLDEDRIRNLRYILQDYHDKIEELKERNVAKLDTDLVRLGQTHRDLVRTWVVPPHHHQEFDQWVGGRPVLLPETRPE